ncbi:MAG: insulinase family protein [Legionella longbeachae]|nr:insulinase family protein [Legionella longbeachae]
MRKILFTLLLLLSCQTFSQVQEFILNNGLKILVKEDHRAPIVVSMLWYKVGSADEPGGITGVSHAIEHMMFKGTEKHPLGVFSKTISAIGGQLNAFTNTDYTAYFEKTDATKLATNFELEADRMNHLLLDANEFAKEIKVIQEERRLRTDNNPQALAFERFLATAHLISPYNHPVIGWMSDLKKMNVNDLSEWYKKYYAPNNATLVVVGDVNPQQVHVLAERYFGAISQHPVPERKLQKEPPVLGKKTIHIQSSAKLPLLMMGYMAPGVSTAKKTYEPYALEIIAAILDGGESSRFAKNLIRGDHVATDADTYYNPYTRYQTQFIIYGAPDQKHNIRDVQKGFLKELDALKKFPISEKELQKVKNQIIAQKTYEKDSLFGQASELGLLETVGLGWKKTEDYTDAINAVTPEQIQLTAQRYFQDKNLTTAILDPQKQDKVTP